MRNKLWFFCSFFLLIHFGFAAQEDPLPSWNKGPTKEAIIEFVKATSDPANSNYVKPEDRIATFDQDGTLWVEHPLYTQAAFALDRVKELLPDHPDWKDKEPFKAIIAGNSEEIAKFNEHDWANIIAVTHAGMTTENFLQIVKKWLATAKHPRFNQPYTKLVYQPMIEVLDYFRANGFKTYIVTGGGQEFVRTYSQLVYGIPPEQIIGSSIATKYEYRDQKPVLMRLEKMFFNSNYGGKAIGINLFIGKRPYAAFGNSDGDREMVEWSEAGDGKRLRVLVHHDDPEREYGYGPAGGLSNTSVGTFSESLMTEGKNKGWTVVSMKNDWKRIFPFGDISYK